MEDFKSTLDAILVELDEPGLALPSIDSHCILWSRWLVRVRRASLGRRHACESITNPVEIDVLAGVQHRHMRDVLESQVFELAVGKLLTCLLDGLGRGGLVCVWIIRALEHQPVKSVSIYCRGTLASDSLYTM